MKIEGDTLKRLHRNQWRQLTPELRNKARQHYKSLRKYDNRYPARSHINYMVTGMLMGMGKR
jgi:hypothetical protein